MPPKQGYDPDFLGARLRVPLPTMTAKQQQDAARALDASSPVLAYIHYSVVLSASRRFPYFSAANVDAASLRKIAREKIFNGPDKWELDPRVAEYQWGKELYEAPSSDFDRGHMTKREDPQWGASDAAAIEAARSTFHFTNCTPQVSELNSISWRALESYIMAEASAIHRKRICVLTGPVLDEKDPVFVSRVLGMPVRLPTLFWKVVYYSDDGKALKRVGFLMGQGNLLYERRIAQRSRGARVYAPLEPLAEHYTDFKDAETYQVNIATIEQTSKLAFAPAADPYKDPRPSKLIITEVQIEGKKRSLPSAEPAVEIRYEGLTL
jgi:endonuclease G, mitochondrial